MNITTTNNSLLLSSPVESGYKYIHYVIKVTLEDEELVYTNITSSESSFVLNTDGYYKVIEIKLPTNSGSGYYISGETVYNPSSEEITTEELLNIDTTGTNIIKVQYDYISIYFINEYYLKILNNQFLKQLKCGCESVNRADKLTVDLLTMGLILVEKLIENSMFYEANRIIYKLSICSNLVNSSNCGCYA